MSKTVAIIGGGYTGLTAAYALSKKNYKVTVYESGPTLGGLASDFSINGKSLERAYHHIFRTDTAIINLAKELGIANAIEWHDSSVSIYYDNKLYSFMSPIDLIKFKPLKPWNRIRAGLVVLYLQKQKRWNHFQNTTAYSWMKKYAGKEVTKVIWEPLLVGKFDKYYDQVSMAWLWARIHIRANSREKGEATEKLGYFTNGFQTFTNALIDKCKRNGVRFVTNCGIEKIASDDQPKLMLKGKWQKYDKILATVPSGVFARLLGNDGIDDAYINKLNSLSYLGAVLLIFSSKQEISKYYWHNINDIGLSFLVFINHTKLIDKKNYGDEYVYYIGAYTSHESKLFNTEDSKLKTKWYKELKKIFADFDTKQITSEYVFHFRNAQHIVDTKYAENIPDHKTPLPNVFLYNFSQIFPEDRGTNYAVAEGLSAASAIIKSNAKSRS